MNSDESKLRILVVMGTRPEAIKMAPVVRALQARNDEIDVRVCATAQHREMLDQVLEIFDVVPDYDLDLMQEQQTLSGLGSRVLTGIDWVLDTERPDWVLVQGDTTTVVMTAIGAYHRQVRVGHVEAGLRTWDRNNPFPEEMNRVITDHVSDLCFAPTESAKRNLQREGIPDRMIRVTGNTVIDALFMMTSEVWIPAKTSPISTLPDDKRWLLVTAHRRENHGRPLENICNALRQIATEREGQVHIVYPVHLNPRVWDPVHKALGGISGISLLPPLDYREFVYLMQNCTMVLTDSGGLQEEAPSLNKPVLVLRETTERPEAVAAGASCVVGTDTNRIVDAVSRLLDEPEIYTKMANSSNPYGDGRASERIVDALVELDLNR
jgi:UDP-N-acetylglucosamine 2-epimerase (non-hydrolysing)